MDRNAVQYVRAAARYQGWGRVAHVQDTIDGSCSPWGFSNDGDKWMRLGLKAFARVALLSLLTSPALVFAQATSEQRRACTPDALRLCSAFIPDADQITACLRQKNAELSDACRQFILAGMKPSDSSGSVGVQGRITR